MPLSWVQVSPYEWTYGDARSDYAEVLRDFWGWWAYDLRFHKRRLIGYSLTLEGAQRRAEDAVRY